MKEELNLQCPYKVFKENEESVYSFTTKNGIEYKVLFSELTNTFNGTSTEQDIQKVYDLTIEKILDNKEPFDPNTSKTVNKIVEEFFKDKDNSIFYTCNHIDKKQKG